MRKISHFQGIDQFYCNSGHIYMNFTQFLIFRAYMNFTSPSIVCKISHFHGIPEPYCNSVYYNSIFLQFSLLQFRAYMNFAEFLIFRAYMNFTAQSNRVQSFSFSVHTRTAIQFFCISFYCNSGHTWILLKFSFLGLTRILLHNRIVCKISHF